VGAPPAVPRLQGVGPNLAINFCVYETVKAKWVQAHPETPTPLVSLGCGSLAGICSSTGHSFNSFTHSTHSLLAASFPHCHGASHRRGRFV